VPDLHRAKMIESPRRHGHHDPRYPASVFALVGAHAEDSPLWIAVWENEGGTTLLGKELSEPLDWSAFSRSRFPDSKRHDLLALTAYGRYRTAQKRISP
jgi:hypothetical protein